MKKEAIDWLLGGPAWLKYAVECQLLNLLRQGPPRKNLEGGRFFSNAADERGGSEARPFQGLGGHDPEGL